MKTITVAVLCFAILFSVDCLAKEQDRGQIVDNLDHKVKMLTGDKAITNLGKKNDVIKGDIFTIFKTNDINYTDPLGSCAVIDIHETTSICEIFKMKSEIGKDAVVLDKLIINDSNLFPVIFKLLTKVVEPYEPHKEITVYVHSILDEQNNITKFSEKMQKEIKKVFYQKKRIKQAGKDVAKALFAYLPSEYAESNKAIEDYIRKDNIDVIITGSYKVKDGKIAISLYKVDKNWEDIIVDTAVDAAPYGELLSTVTVPYKALAKEQNVFCDILFQPIHYKVTLREERNEIIATESKKDPFLEYSLKRVDFNIISPVGFKFKIDNSEIGFEKSNAYELALSTGKHEISASFKKGYYFNDSLVLTNDSEVKKSIILSIDKPEDVAIEVEVNPVPGRENIDFKIYKKAVKTKPMIKPILQKDTVKQVETFKD